METPGAVLDSPILRAGWQRGAEASQNCIVLALVIGDLPQCSAHIRIKTARLAKPVKANHGSLLPAAQQW